MQSLVPGALAEFSSFSKNFETLSVRVECKANFFLPLLDKVISFEAKCFRCKYLLTELEACRNRLYLYNTLPETTCANLSRSVFS